MAVRTKFIFLSIWGLLLVLGVSPSGVLADTNNRLYAPTSTPKVIAGVQVAQLDLNLGGSNQDIKRRLRRQGYREIRITKTSFKNIRAEACFEGIRYAVKVRRLTGKIIRGNEIGKCRKPLSVQQVAAMLKKQGLYEISVAPAQRGNFIAKACAYGRYFRFDINRRGDVLNRQDIGECRRELDIAQVRQNLREQGFNRIRVLGPSELEACLYGDKVRLRLGRGGLVRRQEVIGRCATPIDPQSLTARLRDLGYSRIKVTDDQLPVYKAQACRGNSLMNIRINRFGEVTSELNQGQCNPPLNRQQVVEMLQRRGATRITIRSQDRSGFTARACYKLEDRRYRIDPYGVILNRETVGRCTPPPLLSQVLDDFRARGVTDTRILVEGCRRGRRLRFEINEFGEEINRERLGPC